jgi:hypothetical protein
MDELPVDLNSPDRAARDRALERLLADHPGDGSRPPEADPKINLHAHTFFSYNGYGYSPTYLVALAHLEHWYALATVDFDVLDGVDETLDGAARAGVRASAGIETRVYVTDRSTDVFNSPGEPGVMYYVGMGFTSARPPQGARAVIDGLRSRAQARNREMIARVNAYLAPVSVDYDRDVLPLTPSGNATERHMLIAYDAAARATFADRQSLLAFWADKLSMPVEAVDAFLGDVPFPHDAIRGRLMKQGGPGYMAPTPDSFPPLQDAISSTVACGALPCYAFLDGTYSGEQDMSALLEDMLARGVVGMVLIPDRNWNIADKIKARDLVSRLHTTLDLARALDLPVFAGTEMNKPGQLLIDDLSVPALRDYAPDLCRGADFLFAHTALQRAKGLGYQSVWAQQWLPERRPRTRFYTALGSLLSPSDDSITRAAALMRSDGPEAALARLRA